MRRAIFGELKTVTTVGEAVDHLVRSTSLCHVVNELADYCELRANLNHEEHEETQQKWYAAFVKLRQVATELYGEGLV